MKYKTETDLYKHTLLLNDKQNELIPTNCKSRCVRSTIINRSYYSTYLYVKKYLIINGFEIKKPYYYLRNNKKVITEHQQVLDKLYDKNKKLSVKLKKLKRLRHKADYHPSKYVTIKDVTDSIDIMNEIFQNLKKR
jgi:uncharacterized protein (UPF0332 family)